MAVALAKITYAPDYTAGNRKHRTRTLTFSGNYATNGETITAASVGLRQIHRVDGTGVAAAATPTTAVLVGTVIAADGLSVAVRSYEAAASAAAFLEKDNSEAYITGQNIRLTFVGTT
jgi:hypothetical protein